MKSEKPDEEKDISEERRDDATELGHDVEDSVRNEQAEFTPDESSNSICTSNRVIIFILIYFIEGESKGIVSTVKNAKAFLTSDKLISLLELYQENGERKLSRASFIS